MDSSSSKKVNEPANAPSSSNSELIALLNAPSRLSMGAIDILNVPGCSSNQGIQLPNASGISSNEVIELPSTSGSSSNEFIELQNAPASSSNEFIELQNAPASSSNEVIELPNAPERENSGDENDSDTSESKRAKYSEEVATEVLMKLPEVENNHREWYGPAYLMNDTGLCPGSRYRNHMSDIILGAWSIVYSWPPPAKILEKPEIIKFITASKLEAVLFGCSCQDKLHRLAPIKVLATSIKSTVKACFMVEAEEEVRSCFDNNICRCRTIPNVEKFVILPINEHFLLFYYCDSIQTYTEEHPNDVYLLYKDTPSLLEISHNISGLDITQREGGVTFKVQYDG